PDVDVICGSRFLADLRYVGPVSRRAGIHLFAFILSRIVRQKVTDPTSGFRLYNRRAISLFARDYPHDYPEVEAVLVLHYHRLRGRYAILWPVCSVALLGLSVWKGLLNDLAHAVGIFYAPSALFVIAFAFVLVLLLHFSVAVSRLADQNKVLAQRVALLEEQ